MDSLNRFERDLMREGNKRKWTQRKSLIGAKASYELCSIESYDNIITKYLSAFQFFENYIYTTVSPHSSKVII